MDKLSYSDFISKFSEKAKQKNRLLRVEWTITYRCNLNCQHCYLPSEKRKNANSELNLEQIKNIIDQLYDLGCLEIGLTGGEPLLRKDILKILMYLKGKAFHIFLVTNGTLITEEIAKLLVEFKPLIDVTIPIYSLNENINRQIVKVKGALEKVLNGTMLLKKRNIPVSIGPLLMRNNLKDFYTIKEFARQNKIHFAYDYIVQPRLDGSKDVLRYQIPVSWINKLIKEERDLIKDNNSCQQFQDIKFSKKSIFYCNAGKTSMSLDPYGKANICLFLPFTEFDALKNSVLACWQRLVNFVNDIKPGKNYKCFRCKLGDFCMWCPAMGWCHKKDLNACVPFYKRLAQINRKAFYDRDQTHSAGNF